MEWINARPFKKLPGSRRELFETLDRPALRPLPASRYEFATWRRAKVNIDYHIEVRAERHYYSVPYRLAGEIVEIRLSAASVEVFCRARRVASHVRRYSPGYSTDPAHMPEAHRRHTQWTPGRIVAWAAHTGPATARLTEAVMAARPHPEQGFRSCLGIIRLGQNDTVRTAWRRPAGGRWPPERTATAPSSPSCAPAWTAKPCPPQPRSSLFPSTTTCAGSRYYQ